MKLPHLILLSILITSCGLEGHKGRNPAGDVQLGGALQPQTSIIDGGQAQIAQRVCESLRSKRFSFSSRVGQTFVFRFDQKNCDSSTSSDEIQTSIAQPSISSAMLYDGSSSLPYFRPIETDLHGELRTLCEGILAGRNVEDTESLGTGVIQRFEFFQTVDPLGSGQLVDAYNVIQAISRGENSSFVISDVKEFIMHADSLSSGSLNGVIASRTLRQTCSNETTRETKQTFLRN